MNGKYEEVEGMRKGLALLIHPN